MSNADPDMTYTAIEEKLMSEAGLTPLEASIMAKPNLRTDEHDLAMQLDWVVSEALQKRKDEYIQTILPKKYKGKPPKEWEDKFYADKKDAPIVDKFIYDGEFDNLVATFWRMHPHDSDRLSTKDKADILNLSIDIGQYSDEYHELVRRATGFYESGQYDKAKAEAKTETKTVH